MIISDEYRALNAELHARHPGYGSKGKKWAPRVIEFAREVGARTLLDFGAGKGSLARALDGSGLEVREYDPAVPGKDAEPEPADLVVCTDVLEHVEPEYLDAVIARVVELATVAALVGVACRQGKRRLADGRPDHLIVQMPGWWLQKLWPYGFRPVPTVQALEYAAVLRK